MFVETEPPVGGTDSSTVAGAGGPGAVGVAPGGRRVGPGLVASDRTGRAVEGGLARGEGAVGQAGAGGGSPVAVASAALGSLAGLDVSGLSDDELLGGALALERVQRRLDVVRTHVAGELDARGTTDERHGLRTAGWLAREAGLPRPVAARVVRVGVKLRRMANLDAAFTAGTVGFDQVRVIADAANPRIIDALDAAVPELVEGVEGTRFEVWRRDVAWVADQLDADGGHDPAGDTPADRLSQRWVGDELVIHGRLHGEAAQVAHQVLDGATDTEFRRATRDRDTTADLPVPCRAELCARAFVRLLRHGLAAETAGTATSAPVAEVTFVVHADQPTLAVAPDGSVLPFGRALALLCDPTAIGVVLDDAGVPLDVGRAHRFATPAQRRALAVRDGGCVFPGCDAPVGWCDAHHVTEWDTDHGRTDLANLALLCRHHHGITHRTGWTMTTTPDQWFHWTTPTGHTIDSQRHGRTRHGPAPPP